MNTKDRSLAVNENDTCSSAASRCSDGMEANGLRSRVRSEALLPCPFCGSDDVQLEFQSTLNQWGHMHVRCNECYCRGPSMYCINDKWNADCAKDDWDNRAGQVAPPSDSDKGNSNKTPVTEWTVTPCL